MTFVVKVLCFFFALMCLLLLFGELSARPHRLNRSVVLHLRNIQKDKHNGPQPRNNPIVTESNNLKNVNITLCVLFCEQTSNRSKNDASAAGSGPAIYRIFESNVKKLADGD